MRMKQALVLAAFLATGNVGFSAIIAYDDASDSAYNSGWADGSNGGYGFGEWDLQVVSDGRGGGHFVGTSTGNGDGFDNGTVGGVADDGDIDAGGRAWGMYAETNIPGQYAATVTSVTRPLTGGPLSVGQTLHLSFDNGYIVNGGSIQVDLSNRFALDFQGDLSNFWISDYYGRRQFGMGYGDEGFDLYFTLTSTAGYTFSFVRADGSTQGWDGILLAGAFGNVDITEIQFVNSGAGDGSSSDFFINSMSVTQPVPEPATTSLLVAGLLGILMSRRRKAASSVY